MRQIKVVFEDRDTLITRVNGTVEEIESYYIGAVFNMGTVTDIMKKAVNVEFLN